MNKSSSYATGPSSRRTDLQDIVLLALLWLGLCIPSLLWRPLWPIDETRYVGVAWEMWARHNFLVPYLNGVPYSHKPPLLFWFIHIGWWAFGVNDWWPRAVPALFGLGSIFLLKALVRSLSAQGSFYRGVPFVLMGCLFWISFNVFLMFDMMLTFFVLLGLIGITQLARHNKKSGVILVCLGIGLGILSKGPVIFVHLLPTALLAPFWGKGIRKSSWTTYYTVLALAIIVGIILALLWALPAAYSGGKEYKNAILWGQTAHRVVHSFAHNRPIWWYIVLLPIILYPWSLWPPVWRNLKNLSLKECIIRFSICMIAPGLLIFSLISGKQIYYLLPSIPLFSILIADLLKKSHTTRASHLLVMIVLLCVGIVWAAAPVIWRFFQPPPWAADISPTYGFLLIATVLAGFFSLPLDTEKAIKWMAGFSVFTFMILQAGTVNVINKMYDVRPISSKIAAFQKEGIKVANARKYHGEYHFYGRLKRPLVIIKKSQIDTWFKENPDGKVIAYYKRWPRKLHYQIEYVTQLRGRTVAIISKRKAPKMDS